MTSLVCVSDYEKKAEEILRKSTWEYFRDGAGHFTTLNLNKDCYKKLRLRPKCLRDVSKMDLSTNIFGCDTKMPIGISSTGFHKRAHPDGELATARAAEKAGVIYTVAGFCTYSLEEIAKAAPNGVRWYQLYFDTNRSFVEELVRKVEKNGYKAIAVTVDSPVCPNAVMYSRKRAQGVVPSEITVPDYEGHRLELDKSLSWKDLEWLCKFTTLPVIAKGVQRADDALKAVEAGCKGILVSNHGARLVDTAPATIEALPEIVEAVGGKAKVIIDGGVTLGTDALKALALGADFVLVGRPILWGLTVNGQAGVEDILGFFKNELQTTMMLCGVPTVKDITADLVAHESFYMDKLAKALKKL